MLSGFEQLKKASQSNVNMFRHENQSGPEFRSG